MEHIPPYAPFSVLAFLGTGFVLGLLVLGFLIGAVSKTKWLKTGAATVAALLLSGYFLALFGASLASNERILAGGDRKYFCEIDCHLAYSVAGAEEVRVLGDESHPVPATGRFVVVHLKTWFDPQTISPQRGNGPLTPNPRRVTLVDDRGREFAPSPSGQAALAAARGASTSLMQPLRPGESYVTDVVFDLPADAHNPKLFVEDDFGVDSFLIGHENSPLHKKTYLGLRAGDAPQASSSLN